MNQVTATALIAFCLRIVFIYYGEWQDTVSEVKFTDVDYFVFQDAAKFVSESKSPYERHTYRYTPLLSWLLLPNIYLHKSFGKLLFSVSDVIVGVLLYKLLQKTKTTPTTTTTISSASPAPRDKNLWLVAALWWFNPITVTVSTRGNAEALLCCCLLFTIYLAIQRKHTLSAILLGVSIHLKLFPLVYTLPLMLYSGDQSVNDSKRAKLKQGQNMISSSNTTVLDWLRNLLLNFFSPTSILYMFTSLGTFAVLGSVMYIL